MENQPETELGFRCACMLHDVPRAGCSRARPPRLSRVTQCRLLPGPPDAAVTHDASATLPGVSHRRCRPPPAAPTGSACTPKLPSRPRLSPSRRPLPVCGTRPPAPSAGAHAAVHERSRQRSRLEPTARRPHHTRASHGARTFPTHAPARPTRRPGVQGWISPGICRADLPLSLYQ